MTWVCLPGILVYDWRTPKHSKYTLMSLFLSKPISRNKFMLIAYINKATLNGRWIEAGKSYAFQGRAGPCTRYNRDTNKCWISKDKRLFAEALSDNAMALRCLHVPDKGIPTPCLELSRCRIVRN